jgi:disulfide bond formation protein DsbB
VGAEVHQALNLIRFAKAGNFPAKIHPNRRTNRGFHVHASIRTIILNSAMNLVMNWLDNAPRRVLVAIFLACLGLLAFGMYLQLVVGLEPCPMCVVQRYALILIAVVAGITSATGRKGLQITGVSLLTLLAVAGAYVAARQSWLQWYPPEVVSCGRDIYGMIENFPLQRAIPMIFKGGGDCTKVDWTFLGGTIANWSFVWFCAMAIVGALLLWRGARKA